MAIQRCVSIEFDSEVQNLLELLWWSYWICLITVLQRLIEAWKNEYKSQDKAAVHESSNQEEWKSNLLSKFFNT